MLLIGWTTVAQRADADRLASGLIDSNLAVCVQIEGPITSHYRWENRVEKTEEFRLTIKLLPDRKESTEAWLLSHHPYKTPEWIVVEAKHVGEKYLSWAATNPNH